MPQFKTHAPGTACYVELVSPDPDGSRDFYMTLFGWDVRNEDLGEHGIYTQFLKDGDVVAALFKLSDEMAAAGTPPNWGVYLSVEDVDKEAERAKDLGASVIMGPMDVFTHGRMTVLGDPQGAVFCLWQAKDHLGVGCKDEPGALCWTEIMTSNAAAAVDFYSQFFGWTSQEMPLGEGQPPYIILGPTPETPSTGLIEIQPEMGPIPPHWLAYFQVDDLAVTHGKAVDLGAKSLMPPTDIPGGSQFCMIQDPQGAVCGIYQAGPEA